MSETPEMTNDDLENAIAVAGTLPLGGSWSEVLGIEAQVILDWRKRGIDELRRVAETRMRRMRRSEERYVLFARLTGLADGEVRARTGDNALVRPSRRPLSLTRQMIDDYADALWEYDTIAAAAQAIGKTSRTIYNWLNAGRAIAERIDEAHDDPEADAPELSAEDELRLTFFRVVSRVEAEKTGEAVRAMRAGFTGARNPYGSLLLDRFGRPVMAPDWRAADKYLERRFPREWRGMDPAGDKDSATVKAVQAGRPLGIVVVHPAAALDELCDDEDAVVREAEGAVGSEPVYLGDEIEVFGG